MRPRLLSSPSRLIISISLIFLFFSSSNAASSDRETGCAGATAAEEHALVDVFLDLDGVLLRKSRLGLAPDSIVAAGMVFAPLPGVAPALQRLLQIPGVRVSVYSDHDSARNEEALRQLIVPEQERAMWDLIAGRCFSEAHLTEREIGGVSITLKDLGHPAILSALPGLALATSILIDDHDSLLDEQRAHLLLTGNLRSRRSLADLDAAVDVIERAIGKWRREGGDLLSKVRVERNRRLGL